MATELLSAPVEFFFFFWASLTHTHREMTSHTHTHFTLSVLLCVCVLLIFDFPSCFLHDFLQTQTLSSTLHHLSQRHNGIFSGITWPPPQPLFDIMSFLIRLSYPIRSPILLIFLVAMWLNRPEKALTWFFSPLYSENPCIPAWTHGPESESSWTAAAESDFGCLTVTDSHRNNRGSLCFYRSAVGRRH